MLNCVIIIIKDNFLPASSLFRDNGMYYLPCLFNFAHMSNILQIKKLINL